MASTPTTYPKIGRKIWWLLRSRLKQSIPSTVTTTMVTALSPMTEDSARANVLSPLRDLHLLDTENKPTPLAARWRHDDDYAAVCKEIREKVYPGELLEAFPDATPEKKQAIQNWFMRVGHVGESAARMYSDTFLLLSQADPKGAEEANGKGTTRVARPSVSTAKATPTPKRDQRKDVKAEAATPPPPPAPQLPEKRLPAIHIDVQVHISPDTTTEQIDRIFASMAKHLGGFVS